MRYLIDGEEVREEDFYSQLEESVEDYCENNYDDMIDDCTGEIAIGNITFNASYVLEKLDPIAYNCGLGDYIDSVLNEAKYDLEKGHSVSFENTDFEIEEEEELEEDEDYKGDE